MIVTPIPISERANIGNSYPGVSYDPISGALFYKGYSLPTDSYEGLQALIGAIDNRRTVTFQDYSNQAGPVTRTYDPISRSQAVGPPDSNTQVSLGTPTNPAPSAPPQNNPPNPQVESAADTAELPAPQQTPTQDPQANQFVFDENGELIPSDSVQGIEIIERERRIENELARDVGGNFAAVDNTDGTGPGDQGTWYIVNEDTGEIVAVNLTEQEAILQAQELSVGDPGYGLGAGVQGPTQQTQAQQRAQELANLPAGTLEAAKERARIQATLQAQQNQANQGDWRVKLRLAPGARYLYRGADGQGVQAGILKPLAVTDGVIFPYTPQISTSYRASYNQYDLTHSNYRGYFYQGSHVEAVQLTAMFTAQDTTEANYLLAVIHFFRSVTKMFYGQDEAFRGSPPPLVYLQGFGQYQFALHPCVVSSFDYTLPNDVDYIRADVSQITGTNLQVARQRQDLPTNPFSGALARLSAAGLPKGGINIPPAPTTLGTQKPTYVPTSMEIRLELLPMQSREQVSREFSLEKFANGNLQRAGFW